MEASHTRPVLVEYPVRLSLAQIAGMIGAIALVAAGMAWLAHGNERGLSLWRLIELSPEQATLFYSAFAAVLGLAVLPAACALSVRTLQLAQRLAFVEGGVLLPASPWSREEREIRFTEIEDLCVVEINKEAVATLTVGGRKLRIGRSWLPTPSAFDDVLVRLQRGMAQARELAIG
ncbi:MAG: hypothetical protein CL910_04720 [Deltaproteobacteria bacterium]|jgi:hypothetical protein|nr:hypothetical protein [Deltaproteobacteria bacterium]